VPVAQIETHTGQIPGVQPVHDEHNGAVPLVIQPRRERRQEKRVRLLALPIALGLRRIVRVVDDNPIAALPGGGAAHGGGGHRAASIVAIFSLLILIGRELKLTAPAVLVPRRLQHRPPVQ
jgi:hypothetical protein